MDADWLYRDSGGCFCDHVYCNEGMVMYNQEYIRHIIAMCIPYGSLRMQEWDADLRDYLLGKGM